jgi:very-short-patch-repair endonuclease
VHRNPVGRRIHSREVGAAALMIATNSVAMSTHVPPTAADRRRRWRREAADLARTQDGVLSRRQLMGLGISRWQVRAEIQAGRWRSHGRHSVAVHTRELEGEARWWWAVLETAGDAMITASTALVAAGLTGYEGNEIHVAVLKSRHHHRPRGVVVHETRRLSAEDRVNVGLPRTRVPMATVLAALWARSDRQACFVVLMTINQGLVSVQQLQESSKRVRRDKRRKLLRWVIVAAADGVRAMGELDFAVLCRRRGLPEPDRQVIRTGRNGRVYLDVYWDQWRVIVEIEGVGHFEPLAVVSDALRQNKIAIEDGVVLRIPVVGLRTQPADFMDQVEAALREGGCPLPRRAAAA